MGEEHDMQSCDEAKATVDKTQHVGLGDDNSFAGLLKDNISTLSISVLRVLFAIALCIVLLFVGAFASLPDWRELGGDVSFIVLSIKSIAILYLIFPAAYFVFRNQINYVHRYFRYVIWKKNRDNLLRPLSTYLLARKSNTIGKSQKEDTNSDFGKRVIIKFARFVAKRLKLDELASDLGEKSPAAVSTLMRRLESEIVEKHLISKPSHAWYFYLLGSMLVAGFLLIVL